MKKFFILFIIAVILLGGIFYTTFATSKFGSSGEEVKQIQSKLKSWGFYSGSIDGVYGSKTVEAVKAFQRKNGLTADGVAGEKTLSALGIQSSSGGSGGETVTANNSNLNLLSKLIYGEARGEEYRGQVAVAATVLNRVANSKFPNTVSGVIYQNGAYTAVSDGQINLTPDATARKAAQDAINGWDPTSRLYILF